ncbi:hypothetical protein BC829DRAFT_463453 [Chytridium lagenaria]|nr:hypothetical protein BC829DRAFT_463453 [Chytridium lagenaria]
MGSSSSLIGASTLLQTIYIFPHSSVVIEKLWRWGRERGGGGILANQTILRRKTISDGLILHTIWFASIIAVYVSIREDCSIHISVRNYALTLVVLQAMQLPVDLTIMLLSMSGTMSNKGPRKYIKLLNVTGIYLINFPLAVPYNSLCPHHHPLHQPPSRPNDSKEVLKDIAQEIGQLFHDFDWAPSDIVLGLILIKREQKRVIEVLQARRILMERERIRSPQMGKVMVTPENYQRFHHYFSANPTIPLTASSPSIPIIPSIATPDIAVSPPTLTRHEDMEVKSPSRRTLSGGGMDLHAMGRSFLAPVREVASSRSIASMAVRGSEMNDGKKGEVKMDNGTVGEEGKVKTGEVKIENGRVGEEGEVKMKNGRVGEEGNVKMGEVKMENSKVWEDGMVKTGETGMTLQVPGSHGEGLKVVGGHEVDGKKLTSDDAKGKEGDALESAVRVSVEPDVDVKSGVVNEAGALEKVVEDHVLDEPNGLANEIEPKVSTIEKSPSASSLHPDSALVRHLDVAEIKFSKPVLGTPSTPPKSGQLFQLVHKMSESPISLQLSLNQAHQV